MSLENYMVKKYIIIIFSLNLLSGTDIEKALSIAGNNKIEIQQAITNVPSEYYAGMEWLITHMPDNDLKTLSSQFLINNCRLAYEALESSPWGSKVPEEIFFDVILPYASLNENREEWREDFRKNFFPIVNDVKTSYKAAILLNHQIFDKVGVKYSTDRPKADQSPYESINAGMASCTGLSILLIDACRSVGIPARFVGTPLWYNDSGNHSWVEIWDNGWHFTGAAEPTGEKLDVAWFEELAGNAKKGDMKYGIFAVTWNSSEIYFPMNWLPGIKTYGAVDVTNRYAITDEDVAELIPIRIRSLDLSGLRKSEKITVIEGDNSIFEGITKNETCDANDNLTFMIPKGKTITVKSMDDVQVVDVIKEEIIDLRTGQFDN